MRQLLFLFLLFLPQNSTPYLPAAVPGQSITAQSDNEVIDCKARGTPVLQGNGSGTGIVVQGHRGVVVRNCQAHGFELGLLVSDASRVTVRDSDFSGNYVDDNNPLDLGGWYPKGGMMLFNTTNSVVQNVTASGNIAGVQVINGGSNVLRLNHLNKNRGWGIRLMNSPRNRVEENEGNYNNRSCWSGTDSGCESAGIAIVNSDYSVVVGNTFNFSGDGIYQGNTPERASNNCAYLYNTLDDNSANGIEATFSHDNRFIGNELQRNNYGFWLGYGSFDVVSGNYIENNRVSPLGAEHSQSLTLVNNNIPLSP
ncbi:MAG: right-handed parallel beta-helix repeat-containing protein [Anaerolineae bacterium]